jgi:hypothetical protein
MRPFRLAAHGRVGHGHTRHARGVGGDGGNSRPPSAASQAEASSKTATACARRGINLRDIGRRGIGLRLRDLRRDSTPYDRNNNSHYRRFSHKISLFIQAWGISVTFFLFPEVFKSIFGPHGFGKRSVLNGG